MVVVFAGLSSTGSSKAVAILKLKLKSLIMAQIERWRQALYMQVVRKRWSLLQASSGGRVSNA